MRPGKNPFKIARGFTLIELLLTITIIAILASLLLPALESARGKAARTRCGSNLKQVGIAFQAWGHDHEDKYPMEVSTNSHGTLEFAQTGESMLAFRHFQAISNELGDTKILICPSDKRVSAATFDLLENSNVSYAVNTRASFGRADSVLASDRNVRTSGRMEYTYLQFGPNDAVEWSGTLHGFRGNVLFADSHIESIGSRDARKAFGAGGEVVLVVPQADVGSAATPGGAAPGGATAAAAGTPSTAASTAAANQSTSGSKTAAAGSDTSSGAGGGQALASPSTSGQQGLAQGTTPVPADTAKGPSLAESGSERRPAVTGAAPPPPAPADPALAAATTSAPPAKNVTNAPARAVAALPPPDRDDEDWRASYGRSLGKMGSRFTYLLLLVLLAIFLTLEMIRRRRKTAKRAK